MQYPDLKNIYVCFPGGKNKVLTMSFDDACIEDRQLVALFNRYGIKGTFNLNSGWGASADHLRAEEWAQVYQGHEIACHTRLHPTITRTPLEQVARQVLEDRMALEAITGAPVRGLAYPNGHWSPEIAALLHSLGIRYARVVGDSHSFSLPQDYMAWTPTCHHQHGLLEDGQRFVDSYKSQYLYMMYVWGHGFEFTSPEDWARMERFCEMTGGRQDTWYATNIEIADYMADAARLAFTAAGDVVYNPNARSIWIEVDGGKVEIPGGQLVRLF